MPGLAWKDQWLFATLDRKSSVDVPEALSRYFEAEVLAPREQSAYIAFFQGELRRRYAGLTALSAPATEAERRLAPLMEKEDFYAALGAVEGLMANPQGYRLSHAMSLLEMAARRMPADASKQQRARFLELRAYTRLQAGDRGGAFADLQAAALAWPTPANGALAALARLRP
jgi:hypothetical protein